MAHTDDLAIMLDEDLSARVDKLEEEKTIAYKNGCDYRPHEEEIAYVRREQQVRTSRRRAHAAYLDGLQRDFQEQDDLERGLPNFDDRCNREFADAWWKWGN